MMKVSVKDILRSAGMDREFFYPGKKLVKKYIQPGDHKSHCIVMDWHDQKHLSVRLEAGVTGRTPDAKELRLYPVSFQAPTYMDLEMSGDAAGNEEEDEDGETSASGKGGGGGKKPVQKKREDMYLTSMTAFGDKAGGAVSMTGEIKKFVIMGREIAKEAYAQAFENLKTQMAQVKIMAMEMMKDVSDILHKATPGGGLQAKGDETIKYKYDAERTAPMFGGLTPSI